jgi:micrococcal nuclease
MCKITLLSYRFILIIFLSSFINQAYAWQGNVVGVSDGDTITVMHDGRGEKIRLYGIDCPESGQAFGKKAKQLTSQLIFNKQVNVEPTAIDKYGRTVAFIKLGEMCLNEELIVAGLAWVYSQYCTDVKCNKWIELEKEARSEKIGLWSDPNSIAPWDYRHGTNNRFSQGQSDNIISKVNAYEFHGNQNSYKFHKPDCRYFNCKNCTAIFKTREHAIKAGYRPCKICNP